MEEDKEVQVKLAKASHMYSDVYNPWNYSAFLPYGARSDGSPWSPEEVDKLEIQRIEKYWPNIVSQCRYFYRRDPFVATVINKIVDLAINGVILRPGSARDSITSIFDSIRNDLLVFLRSAALEYLVTGIIIPEITFESVDKAELHGMGIKRFESLSLPVEMWLRDPVSVIIKSPMIGGKVSYFMRIPDDLKYFIQNKGKYPSGETDKKLYNELKEQMPNFIADIAKGEDKILIENRLISRYRVMTDNPYPVPYLYPVIESLKHKRNMKRMDYSIAARVISAIQLIKMGSDEFPLTEDNEDQLEELKKEMKWRDNSSTSKNMERIFQLFGNHTLDISWVFPDTKVLLDEGKYKSVNQDIAIGLGFPRILVTGETERTLASDPEIATVSPLQTMQRLREVLFPIVKAIIDTIAEENNLGGLPEVKFMPINMMAVSSFVQGVMNLYETGNLSREDYAEVFGFDIYDQLEKRSKEKEVLDELDLEEFAPVPHSNEPDTPKEGRQTDTE